MPRVFILNDGGHDYSAAEQFGTIVTCSDGRLDREDTALMYRTILPFLRTSSPDDFIILGGLSSLCVVGCAIFASLHGRLNLLLYTNGEYHARNLSFHNLTRTSHADSDA